MGNPRPLLLARELELRGSPRVVGTNHLKLELGRGGRFLPAIGFGLADRIPPGSLDGGPLDAVFQLTVNEYRGVRSPQLRLRDVRPAGGEISLIESP
jgi:single-stranded-DNA-specific exonuclease